MISLRNVASSHSSLIPLETVYKKRGEFLGAIASKKNFINLHSAAFVTGFARNLVHVYKFYLFVNCARAHETWKQCQWIMWTLTGKHKIWGENWLYLRPYLKAFPVFNVLETCREYFLTIDLGIVEFIKKFIERFFEKCEICRHGPNYVQKL